MWDWRMGNIMQDKKKDWKRPTFQQESMMLGSFIFFKKRWRYLAWQDPFNMLE